MNSHAWKHRLSSTNRLMLGYVLLLLVAMPTTAKSQQGWVASQVASPEQDLNTVYFLDNKRGWVGGDGGFLSRTDDGGQSWVKQSVGTSAAINDIYFRDKRSEEH